MYGPAQTPDGLSGIVCDSGAAHAPPNVSVPSEWHTTRFNLELVR
jgi:hypothetical protein